MLAKSGLQLFGHPRKTSCLWRGQIRPSFGTDPLPIKRENNKNLLCDNPPVGRAEARSSLVRKVLRFKSRAGQIEHSVSTGSPVAIAATLS